MTDRKSTMPKPIMISETIKNGNKAGKTDCKKMFKPDKADLYDNSG